MAIWLMQLALDRWRHFEQCTNGQGADADPLVLITETAHGPRVDAANDAGRREGAAAGMMLADARTLCPQLKVAVSDPAGDLAFLERLALWAQRWGPWSSIDAPDGLLVDVTEVAHLFGGEQRLLDDVHARFAAQSLSVRAAIAPTAGAAWALAHFGVYEGGHRGWHKRGQGSILCDDEDGAARLAPLPVAALRLDADVLLVLRRLGLKRLGDMAELGRDAVQRRFRGQFRGSRSPAANPLMRMDQLLGRMPEPLLPVNALAAPLVQRRLMEPIRYRGLLDQVLGDLADDMVRELEGRGEGARRLELGMWRVDGEVVIRRLELAASTRDAAHICRLFTAKLDDVDAGFGIEMLRLRASWSEPLALAQADLDAAADVHGTSLAACMDRLVVRLGPKAVRRPVPHASHLPECAQIWQPPLEPEKTSQHLLELHSRPLKILERPENISVLYASPDGYPKRFRWRGGVHEVVRVEGPERIAPEWWRQKGSARLRDYYRIEDDAGRRYWIYRDGLADDGRGGMPDWFLQGMFA